MFLVGSRYPLSSIIIASEIIQDITEVMSCNT